MADGVPDQLKDDESPCQGGLHLRGHSKPVYCSQNEISDDDLDELAPCEPSLNVAMPSSPVDAPATE